jgi:hypothetical protein
VSGDSGGIRVLCGAGNSFLFSMRSSGFRGGRGTPADLALSLAGHPHMDACPVWGRASHGFNPDTLAFRGLGGVRAEGPGPRVFRGLGREAEERELALFPSGRPPSSLSFMCPDSRCPGTFTRKRVAVLAIYECSIDAVPRGKS